MTYDARHIETKIELWHLGDGQDMELYEYLGWTWEQYKVWVETDVLPDE